MFKFKLLVQVLAYGSLGIASSLYITGCGGPSIPKDTQIYEVNGAKVCDHRKATPDTRDDCNNTRGGSSGYFYNPSNSHVFYRGGGEDIIVDRNHTPSNSRSLYPGGTVPLKSSIITNQSGTPLMDGSSVVTSTSRSSTSINTTPVRSTASFNSPSLGKVSAGRTTSVGRGMSFGSGGRGGFG